MGNVFAWQPPIISAHAVHTQLPSVPRNVPVKPVHAQDPSDPGHGSEIAPENRQRSRQAYDEAVELDELEH